MSCSPGTPSSSAAAARGSGVLLSGAKRGRPDEGAFDVGELMDSLQVSGDYLILGIDEAGRGPVLGPMVYTGAVVSLAEHARLVEECHVADSKALDERRRDAALLQLEKLSSFRSFTVSLSAAEISAAMTGRTNRNLNTLSHDTAIEIISMATLAGGGKLCAVFVDTVGPPEAYQSRLAGRFPHLRVTVAKRADSRYPVVSAASIVAKTTRDAFIQRLGLPVGSGYPGDPATMPWVRSHVHRLFVVPSALDFVRQSWGPVAQLAADAEVCVPVRFEQDEDNERKRSGGAPAVPQSQSLWSFTKGAPKRPVLYSHMLKLTSVASV